MYVYVDVCVYVVYLYLPPRPSTVTWACIQYYFTISISIRYKHRRDGERSVETSQSINPSNQSISLNQHSKTSTKTYRPNGGSHLASRCPSRSHLTHNHPSIQIHQCTYNVNRTNAQERWINSPSPSPSPSPSASPSPSPSPLTASNPHQPRGRNTSTPTNRPKLPSRSSSLAKSCPNFPRSAQGISTWRGFPLYSQPKTVHHHLFLTLGWF